MPTASASAEPTMSDLQQRISALELENANLKEKLSFVEEVLKKEVRKVYNLKRHAREVSERKLPWTTIDTKYPDPPELENSTSYELLDSNPNLVRKRSIRILTCAIHASGYGEAAGLGLAAAICAGDPAVLEGLFLHPLIMYHIEKKLREFADEYAVSPAQVLRTAAAAARASEYCIILYWIMVTKLPMPPCMFARRGTCKGLGNF